MKQIGQYFIPLEFALGSPFIESGTINETTSEKHKNRHNKIKNVRNVCKS